MLLAPHSSPHSSPHCLQSEYSPVLYTSHTLDNTHYVDCCHLHCQAHISGLCYFYPTRAGAETKKPKDLNIKFKPWFISCPGRDRLSTFPSHLLFSFTSYRHALLFECGKYHNGCSPPYWHEQGLNIIPSQSPKSCKPGKTSKLLAASKIKYISSTHKYQLNTNIVSPLSYGGHTIISRIKTSQLFLIAYLFCFNHCIHFHLFWYSFHLE